MTTMLTGHLISRRMLAGAVLFSLYGLWTAVARLPEHVGGWILVLSALWTVAIFSAGGAILAGAVAGLAVLVTSPIPTSRRAGLAAIVETLCWCPLLLWLLLNEFVYSTTLEVLGSQTLRMAWSNAAATLEAAWEMARVYLLIVAGLTTVGVIATYIFARRSYLRLWPSRPHHLAASLAHLAGLSREPRIGRSLTGGLVVLAVLLTWQARTQPSRALTTVLRSAPPLRAMNLTQRLLRPEFPTTAPATGRTRILPDDVYARSLQRRADAPNIILIVLESVPARALGCYGASRPDVTPNMDRLAAEGVLFEHCWSSASFSSYGLLSIDTSLHLLRAPYNDHFANPTFPFMSIGRVLKLAGYETALFSSGNETFDNIRHFRKPADFDTYYCHETSGREHPDCMRMDDRFAVEQFEQWLPRRDRSRPLFASFYLQSTHFNYEVPEPWASYYQPTITQFGNGDSIIRIPPEVLPGLRNQFDNALRYSDHWVGRIRSALAAAGELDNCVIVIVGDHGEGFMEHGLARHGLSLWEEMIHVPLIWYLGPEVRRNLGRPLSVRIADTVSSLDIAPTICGLIGLPVHPSWQGRDVLAPGYSSRDRTIFAVLQLTRWQEAVTVNGYKYIYDLTDVQPRLFDLRHDPGERVDLIDSRPEVAERMHQILSAWHNHQLEYYAQRSFTTYVGIPDTASLAAGLREAAE